MPRLDIYRVLVAKNLIIIKYHNVNMRLLHLTY